MNACFGSPFREYIMLLISLPDVHLAHLPGEGVRGEQVQGIVDRGPVLNQPFF